MLTNNNYVIHNSISQNLNTVPGNNTISVNGPEADILINGASIVKTMHSINERLLLISPDLEKLEKYAALKNAYDHYKLIEAMCGDNT